MIFDILTTFPESFSYLSDSIIKRAQEKEIIQVNIHNLRKWALDKHNTTDDRPFGGNAGMLMKIEPLYLALKELGVYPTKNDKTKVILTSASGSKWNQNRATEFRDLERVVIICGHYEGVDYRIKNMIDEEISIGDYVLSGGELPAQILIDSITRLLPGVLGNEDSLKDESHNEKDLKEYPQYTRPSTFKTLEGEEWNVPDVLLSGNHKEIDQWKNENRKMKNEKNTISNV